MKRPGLLNGIILTLITVTFTNCTKTSTTENNSNIEYKLQTINPSSILPGTTSGNIQWTAGQGNATQIAFEAKSNNKNVDFSSIITNHISLFPGIIIVGVITLPPASYDDVKFKVDFNAHGNFAAFELNGQFTNGNNTTPVLFKVHNKLVIETEKTNVIISSNNKYSATSSLNLSLITNGISETMLTNAVRTNGTIVISVNSNSNIYQIILKNLSDCDVMEFKG